jgi:ankyrin repeat protein
MTALYRAASRGHKWTVQLLLKKGADIKAKDTNGRTAFDLAASKQYKSIVQLLLENRASPINNL